MKTSRASASTQSNSAVDDLAIRFVNTAAWRLRSDVEERLPSPTDLLSWLRTNGLINSKQLKALRAEWKHDGGRAQSIHRGAIALRELIYKLLSARIDCRAPAEKDVEVFNHFLCGDGPRAAIAWRGGAYGWHAPGTQATASGVLMPIALSAAELLTGIRAHKVQQCQDDRGCGWLFVDESRAQNRRWCSMGDCGNRAKAHRHYEKVKGHTAKPGSKKVTKR